MAIVECYQQASKMGTSGQDNEYVEYLVGTAQYVIPAGMPFLWNSSLYLLERVLQSKASDHRFTYRICYSANDVKSALQYEPREPNLLPHEVESVQL